MNLFYTDVGINVMYIMFKAFELFVLLKKMTIFGRQSEHKINYTFKYVNFAASTFSQTVETQ